VQFDIPSRAVAQPDLANAPVECRGEHRQRHTERDVDVGRLIEQREDRDQQLLR